MPWVELPAAFPGTVFSREIYHEFIRAVNERSIVLVPPIFPLEEDFWDDAQGHDRLPHETMLRQRNWKHKDFPGTSRPEQLIPFFYTGIGGVRYTIPTIMTAVFGSGVIDWPDRGQAGSAININHYNDIYHVINKLVFYQDSIGTIIEGVFEFHA